MACVPGKDSCWSVFAVHMKTGWVFSLPLSTLRRLIRLGGRPCWSESSLSAHAILLVFSWGGLYHVMNILSIKSQQYVWDNFLNWITTTQASILWLWIDEWCSILSAVWFQMYVYHNHIINCWNAVKWSIQSAAFNFIKWTITRWPRNMSIHYPM